MSTRNDSTNFAERQVLGYSAAGRITAYGNTVRIVYENVLWRPNRLTAYTPEGQVSEDDKLSVLVDALVE